MNDASVSMTKNLNIKQDISNKKPLRFIWLLYVLLIIYMFYALYPLVWLAFSSLKTNNEFLTSPWSIPADPQWHNYVDAWSIGKVGQYFFNSVFVTVIAVILAVLFSAMAAFALTRMRWRFKSQVLTLFLSGIMIPGHAILVSLFTIVKTLGLYNSYWGLIVLYTAFALPSTIFILTGTFGSIPKELEEAAIIEGCSVYRVFYNVILPISTTIIATVVIINFLWMWNELLFAIVFVSKQEIRTLPVGLLNFVGRYGTNYAPMMAGIAITIIPTIVMYIFFQDKITAGIIAGAVKG